MRPNFHTNIRLGKFAFQYARAKVKVIDAMSRKSQSLL